MRFHVLLVVRDEVDILAQTLPAILSWADTVHVFDTGSTDGTWELLQAAAARDPRVRCHGRERVYFSIAVTAWLFQQARGAFSDGDWVVRADADEFHVIAPPRFVRERLGRLEARIYGAHYDFQLTDAELHDWNAGLETLDHRARPIQDRRRWFQVNENQELRLFRYRRRMQWTPGRYEPSHPGLVARARIPILHYPKRDPPQIRLRYAIRAATLASGAPVGPHWAFPDWRDTIRRQDDPLMRYWTPGAPLPDVPRRHFIAGPFRRAAQVAYYGAGIVRLVDRMRPPFPHTFAFSSVPDGIEAGIARAAREPAPAR